MRILIKLIKSKYYVFQTDSYGNEYDTMHHFDTLERARSFAESITGISK